MRGKKYFSRILSTLCAVLFASVFVKVQGKVAQLEQAILEGE